MALGPLTRVHDLAAALPSGCLEARSLGKVLPSESSSRGPLCRPLARRVSHGAALEGLVQACLMSTYCVPCPRGQGGDLKQTPLPSVGCSLRSSREEGG